MKNLALILSIGIVLGFSTLSSADLVVYYPFNGNANDVISEYNGTVHGAVLTTDRFGNTNSAYSFNGNHNYIAIPEILSPSTSNITVSAWVKPNIINDSAGIFYKGIPSGEMILRTNWANTYDIGVKLSDGSWLFTGGGTIDIGIWQFIVGTYSKGDKIQIWVDGVLENSMNISNLNLFNGLPNALSSIGSYQQNTAGFFNGIIDDVAIYNYALSATEIQTLANDRPPSPTPEPATMLLLGFGLVGLAGIRRKFSN